MNQNQASQTLATSLLAAIRCEIERQLTQQAALLQGGLLHNEEKALKVGQTMGQLSRSVVEQRSLLTTVQKRGSELQINLTKTLREIGKVLHASADHTKEHTAISEETRQQIEKLLKGIQVIDAIASSTRIMAINLRIEAAHLGNAGRPIAVVAQSMSQMATEVAQASSLIGELAQAAVDQLETMGQAARNLEQEAIARIGWFEAVNEICQKSLDESISGMDEAIIGTSEVAEILRQGTSAVTANMQQADHIQQVVRAALTHGTLINDTLLVLSQSLEGDPSGKEPDIAQLVENAVRIALQKQRDPEAGKRLIRDPELKSGELHFL